jgi:chromate reductase
MTLIVSATNRLNSNTLILSKYYQKILKQKGEDVQLLSLTDLPEKLIATDLYKNRSEEFLPIQELVTNAQKLLFVIPEYNGSFPGVLKVFIDACDFPHSFSGKKAALVGHSSGKYGNIRGIDHFTGVCHYVGLDVLPLKIHLTYINKELDENGDLTHADTIKFCHEQIDKFIKF